MDEWIARHIFGNSLFAKASINAVWNSAGNGYRYHRVLQRECEAAHSITQFNRG
jgi:hypothetical protein